MVENPVRIASLRAKRNASATSDVARSSRISPSTEEERPTTTRPAMATTSATTSSSPMENPRGRALRAQRLSQLEWLTMIFPVTMSYFQPPGSPESAAMFKLPILMSTIARELVIGSFGT